MFLILLKIDEGYVVDPRSYLKENLPGKRNPGIKARGKAMLSARTEIIGR
jgi:hypothetical protein